MAEGSPEEPIAAGPAPTSLFAGGEDTSGSLPGLLLAELGCTSPGGPLRLDRVELGEHAVEGSARLVAVGGEGLHDESRAPTRERRSRVGGGVVEHRARSR